MAARSVNPSHFTRRTRGAHAARTGFTLLDVLVVIVVISLLLALMTPSIMRVTESARRVVCASNLHQVGLGLAMWVNDHDGMLPPSRHADDKQIRESSPLLQLAHAGAHEDDWDGLGFLHQGGYLTAASLFYCPSHQGENTFDRYSDAWTTRDRQVVMNYHFRWLATRHRMLDHLNADVTLVTDGLRTVPDYSHATGNNMLKADMRVDWYTDAKGGLVEHLPTTLRDPKVLTFDAGVVLAGLDRGDVSSPNNPSADKKTPLLNSGGPVGW